MGWAKLGGVLLAVVVGVPAARGADTKPADELARLKKDLEKSWEILEGERKPGTTDAEQRAAVDRYYERTRELARRALAAGRGEPGGPRGARGPGLADRHRLAGRPRGWPRRSATRPMT